MIELDAGKLFQWISPLPPPSRLAVCITKPSYTLYSAHQPPSQLPFLAIYRYQTVTRPLETTPHRRRHHHAIIINLQRTTSSMCTVSTVVLLWTLDWIVSIHHPYPSIHRIHYDHDRSTPITAAVTIVDEDAVPSIILKYINNYYSHNLPQASEQRNETQSLYIYTFPTNNHSSRITRQDVHCYQQSSAVHDDDGTQCILDIFVASSWCNLVGYPFEW